MGRPRKPSAMHELSGSFDAHPERKKARELEPKPDGPLGPAPSFFDPNEYTGKRLLAIWNEIIAEAPPGVLTISDRKHVELACRLMYRIRSSTAKSGDYSRLDALLGKMGMNPADRSKVSILPSNVPANEPKRRTTFRDQAEEIEGRGRPN